MEESNGSTNETNVISAALTGRAPVFVITTRAALPEEGFAADVNLGEEQFQQSRYHSETKRNDMPSFPVGSLVAVIEWNACTHIGTVTTDIEDDVAPSFGISVSSMPEAVSLNPMRLDHQQARRPYLYSFAAAIADTMFEGGIRQLNEQEAARLRELIGPFVPDAYLEVYWSETDRMKIRADDLEAERHRAVLSVLLSSMEPLRAVS